MKTKSSYTTIIIQLLLLITLNVSAQSVYLSNQGEIILSYSQIQVPDNELIESKLRFAILPNIESIINYDFRLSISVR